MNPALVIIPTYNERDNLGPITSAVLAADPRVDILVVDDNSPDGTGQLADELAATNTFADHTTRNRRTSYFTANRATASFANLYQALCMSTVWRGASLPCLTIVS